jgi:hypothetical protein
MQAPLLLLIAAELRATFDNMTIDAHGTNSNTSSRPFFGGGRRFVPRLLVLYFSASVLAIRGLPITFSMLCPPPSPPSSALGGYFATVSFV